MIRKTELITRIAKEQRLAKKVVTDVLSELERQVKQALKEGDQVQLMSFGRWYSRERKAGTVKDIRTGERRTVPAGRVAAFRVGSSLKKAVGGGGRATARSGQTFGLSNPFKRKGKKR